MSTNILRKKYSHKGFTIIELMVASAVFTVVLLAALTGFLQIGRMFYKGTSQAATQETAKQLLNDIAESVQVAESLSPARPYGSSGNQYLCVGSVRYSYKIGALVDANVTNSLSTGTGIGMVRDILPGANACAPPCPTDVALPCPSGSVRWNKPVELLGDNMRLQAFSIVSNANFSDYYTINILIAYGEDEVLEEAVAGNPATIRCKGNSATQQFCSVVNYNTSLKRGMNL